MARPGPEARLIRRMRDAARKEFGADLVIVKYHGNEFTEAGVSDLLCCYRGVFVAVEVKAPDNYGGSPERAIEKGVTPKQRAFGARVEKAGGVFAAVATVEDFLSIFHQIDEGQNERSTT